MDYLEGNYGSNTTNEKIDIESHNFLESIYITQSQVNMDNGYVPCVRRIVIFLRLAHVFNGTLQSKQNKKKTQKHTYFLSYKNKSLDFGDKKEEQSKNIC